MGTPLEIKVPSVLVNRATAIFLIRMPSTGSFRTMVDPEQIYLAEFRTIPSIPTTPPMMATRINRPK